MRTVATWVVLGGVLLGAVAARADRVVLRDGTVKDGKVVNQDGEGITLKIDRGGISSTVVIPAANVDRVEISVALPTTRPAVSTTLTATTQGRGNTATQPATRGGGGGAVGPKKPARLLEAMWQLAAGQRPDWGDPRTLPEDKQRLWKKVVVASETGRPEEAVAALLAVHEALRDEPGRIEALAVRYKGQWFGPWLAGLRWEMWKDHAKSGGTRGVAAGEVVHVFDLKEVTEAETPALIGILRSHTAEALDPIRTYLPVPAVKASSGVGAAGGGAGGAKVVRPPDPVLGVTVDNAIDVKEKAGFAWAVLAAQLKLEPAMPMVDRVFLSQQLAEVQRVFGRAADLEGKARAMLRKAKP